MRSAGRIRPVGLGACVPQSQHGNKQEEPANQRHCHTHQPINQPNTLRLRHRRILRPQPLCRKDMQRGTNVCTPTTRPSTQPDHPRSESETRYLRWLCQSWAPARFPNEGIANRWAGTPSSARFSLDAGKLLVGFSTGGTVCRATSLLQVFLLTTASRSPKVRRSLRPSSI